MKISMIAVTNLYQKDGWGLQLLGMALNNVLYIASIANDIKSVVLDAKKNVVEFYEQHRFTLVEATSDENSTFFMFISIRDLQTLDAKRKQFNFGRLPRHGCRFRPVSAQTRSVLRYSGSFSWRCASL